MEEIGSFNELFEAAKIGGFKMESCYQDAAGTWFVRWRRGYVVGKEVQRRLAFNAMLDAYASARDVAASEEIEDASGDLFG